MKVPERIDSFRDRFRSINSHVVTIQVNRYLNYIYIITGYLLFIYIPNLSTILIPITSDVMTPYYILHIIICLYDNDNYIIYIINIIIII